MVVAVEAAPEGFEVLAHTEGAPVAAMQDPARKLYGVQWHPEVKHTAMGQKLIETFLHECAGLGSDWDASSIIEDQVAKIRAQVGDAQVICGLSGGVDSAVAARPGAQGRRRPAYLRVRGSRSAAQG